MLSPGLLIAFPLVGALVLLFFGKRIGRASGVLASAAVGLPFVLGCVLFAAILSTDPENRNSYVHLFDWITVGGFSAGHHSFLPSFAGAKPYHQAFERGVKLIGATCHYVTAELDAGPIIEQDVIRVDHGDTIEDLVRLGRDVEKAVLARGLRYHVQDRVLVHQDKTVVFH